MTTRRLPLQMRRPSRPNEFWNYPRDLTIRSWTDRLKRDDVPPVAIFYGPPSTGKTALARMTGMWASCLACDNENLPCGKCEVCRAILCAQPGWYARHHEYDASGSLDPIVDALWQRFARYNYCMSTSFTYQIKHGVMDDQLVKPSVVFIDELQAKEHREQHRLLKPIESTTHGVVIIATTELERIHEGIVSRAAGNIFPFSAPTHEETASHLQRIAAELGGFLPLELAIEISQRHAGIPRECLGVLEALMAVESEITCETWEKLFPPDHPNRRDTKEFSVLDWM